MGVFNVKVRLNYLAPQGRAEEPSLLVPRGFLALFHEGMGNFTLAKRVIQSVAPFGIRVR